MNDKTAAASRPQLAVSGAIFRDDKLLLVRRAREPSKGLYTFPGGRVEFGETLEEALYREVREETSLSIEIVRLAGWREVLPSDTGGQGHFVILSFACRWKSGQVSLNDELDDARWIAPDAAKDFALTKGLAAIIAVAQREIGK